MEDAARHLGLSDSLPAGVGSGLSLTANPGPNPTKVREGKLKHGIFGHFSA